jgi:hypothetical protein
MQAAEHRPQRDGARWGANHRLWCFQAPDAVRTLQAVVADELGQHGPQVRLVEDEHMIGPIVAQGAQTRSVRAFASGTRTGVKSMWGCGRASPVHLTVEHVCSIYS